MGVSWCAFGPVGAMCCVGARVSRTAAAMFGMVVQINCPSWLCVLSSSQL
jgi:hypothetical protein